MGYLKDLQGTEGRHGDIKGHTHNHVSFSQRFLLHIAWPQCLQSVIK